MKDERRDEFTRRRGDAERSLLDAILRASAPPRDNSSPSFVWWFLGAIILATMVVCMAPPTKPLPAVAVQPSEKVWPVGGAMCWRVDGEDDVAGEVGGRWKVTIEKGAFDGTPGLRMALFI